MTRFQAHPMLAAVLTVGLTGAAWGEQDLLEQSQNRDAWASPKSDEFKLLQEERSN